MRKIMASLDVGSDTIKLVVGEIVKNKLNILSSITVPSLGMKNGLVIKEELLTNSLKDAFSKSEEMLGLKIQEVLVSIPSIDVEFQLSEGKTFITSSDKVIKGIDILKSLQNAITNEIPENMELVNIMPTSFKIDDEKITNNPKGMIGEKLSVKAVLALSPKKIVYQIISILEKLNVKVVDISLSGLGDFYALKSDNLNNEIGVIVNMGKDLTTLSVINKGVLTNSKTIEYGGVNIDNDISFIYKIDKALACEIKNKLALAHKRLAVSSDYEIVTNNIDEEIKINQFELSQIVMSRLTEILNIIKKEINLLTKKEISYIIFTGGLTETIDFSLILEEVFGKDIILGHLNEIGVRNNTYSTCVGLIKYYNEKMIMKDKDYSIFNLEEQKEFSGLNKKNVNDSSILGKLFGYFFDN